jgi:hypothetical protein
MHIAGQQCEPDPFARRNISSHQLLPGFARRKIAGHRSIGGSWRGYCGRVPDTGWTEVVALVAAYVISVLSTPAGISGSVLLAKTVAVRVRVVTVCRSAAVSGLLAASLAERLRGLPAGP